MTEWTARICGAIYLCSFFLRREFRPAEKSAIAVDRQETANPAITRWQLVWMAAAIALTIHMLVALKEVHGWSHQHALDHTAQQTLTRVGINWSGGLYFNYLTVVWWIADCIGLWLSATWAHNRSYRLTFETYLAFMFFNATVVFGPRFWIGVAAALAVLLTFYRRARV